MTAETTNRDTVLMQSVIHLCQRAYYMVEADQLRIIDNVVWRAKLFSCPLTDYSNDDLARAIEYLTLSDSKQKEISLWSGGRRFCIIDYNNAKIIDLQGIPALLNSLFVGIRYDQTRRGYSFEEMFKATLQNNGHEVLFSGEAIAVDGQRREIDASVRLGDRLVLFECRSIERPLDFEIGKIRTIRTRNEFFEEKIIQVLSLKRFIAENPKGRNYDFAWAKVIDCLIVSPFVEWIPTSGSRFWHDIRTPIVTSVPEAIDFVDRLHDSLLVG